MYFLNVRGVKARHVATSNNTPKQSESRYTYRWVQDLTHHDITSQVRAVRTCDEHATAGAQQRHLLIVSDAARATSDLVRGSSRSCLSASSVSSIFVILLTLYLHLAARASDNACALRLIPGYLDSHTIRDRRSIMRAPASSNRVATTVMLSRSHRKAQPA